MKRLAALGAVLVVSCGPPAAPVLEAISPQSPSNVLTPTVSGKAGSNHRVLAYDMAGCNGTSSGEGQADADGKFSFPIVALFNMTTTVSVLSISQDNVRSPCSNDLTYTHDGIAPNAPVVSGTTPASPSTSQGVVVTGTAEAGSTVRLFSTPDCSGTALGSGSSSGNFAVAANVAAGSTTTFYATATDAAGNASACSSTSVTYTHDAVAPAPPVWTGSNPPSPTQWTSVAIQGTAEAGSTVGVYYTSDCSGLPFQTAVAANGTFQFNVTLMTDSVSHYYATATDLAGRRSACSSALDVANDLTSPAAPSPQSTTPASPSNQSTFTVNGTAEPFARVDVYPSMGPDTDGGTSSGGCFSSAISSAYADSSGNWSATINIWWGGSSDNWYAAIANDGAGNASTCSSPIEYRLDQSPPWGGTVTDGLPDPDGGADLDWSNNPTAATVSWSGFYDDLGIGGYHAWVSNTIDCLNFTAPMQAVGPAVSTYAFSGLSLADGMYFGCISAGDTLNNWSTGIASNGFTVDTVAPSLSARSPAPGDTTGNRYLVDLTFVNGPMLHQSADAGVFSIRAGATPVAVATSWSGTEDRVTLAPLTPLDVGTTYTLALTGVRDLAGNVMADTSWTFTAGRAWRPEELVASSVYRGTSPSKLWAARLPGAETLIAWDNNSNVSLARAFPIQGRAEWGNPPGSYGGDSPMLAFNDVGVGGVTFIDDFSGHKSVFQRYLADPVWTNTWPAFTNVDPVGSTWDSAPRLVVDAAGNMTLAFVKTHVMAARYDQATATWGAPSTLETSSYTPSSPSIAVDADGNVTAVWIEQLTAYNLDVKSSRWTAAGGWSAPVLIEALTGICSSPRVVALANGEMLAVWARTGELWWNRYVPATGWGTEAQLASSTNVVFDVASGGGSALVVWEENVTGAGGATTQIRAAKWPSGGSSFQAAEAISGEGCAAPAVGLDSTGAGAAAFRCLPASYVNWDLKARAYASGTWGAPADLFLNSSYINDIHVAARDGAASVVWFAGYYTWLMDLHVAQYE